MSTALMICKALIERCPLDEQSKLLQLMPEEEQKRIQALPSASLPTPQSKKIDPLDHVHFSWIAPILRNFSPYDLRLFLSALSKKQIEGLKKLLGFSEALPRLTPYAKEFIRAYLLKELTTGQELLEPDFIPPSPLRALIRLESEKLVELIQTLGLYDLAFEMKQIISKEELGRILQCLSEPEVQFVKSLSHQADPLIFKRFFLQGWDGKRPSLHLLLQERGRQRLGNALYNQDISLVWAITHAFDVKEGLELFKFCVTPVQPRMQSILIEQILTTLEARGVKSK